MSCVGCVNVRIGTVVWDELVVFKEGEAEKKIKVNIKNNKVGSKKERNNVMCGVVRSKLNRELLNDVAARGLVFAGRSDRIWDGELDEGGLDCITHMGADDVELGAGVKKSFDVMVVVASANEVKDGIGR